MREFSKLPHKCSNLICEVYKRLNQARTLTLESLESKPNFGSFKLTFLEFFGEFKLALPSDL